MAPIPQTMRAVVVEKTGGPEVLEYRTDYPIPAPKQGQVLIKNKFAGINYIDTYFRTGLYPSTKPEILGREASGIVASLGSGPNKLGFKEGERVVFMSNGAYAEYSAIPAENVVRIPDGVSDEDAVGGYLMGMTALSLVRESYPVKKGDTVLLHAAAGGVGLLMCQILKGLGAKTIGTAGGAEKIALAKQNGADEVIDYKAERDGRWLEKVKQLTNGEGVDVVYDSVGKDTWEGSLDAVKRKGSVIFYGNSSGPVPPFPVAKLAAKNSKVMRPTLNNYTVTREELEYYASEWFKVLQSGQAKIKYHNIYPLKDAQQCHIDLEGRKTTGKCLLRI